MNLNFRKFASALHFGALFVLMVGLTFLNLGRASAQSPTPIPYNTSGSTYTQDFNNLFTTVPANNTAVAATVLPPGFGFVESGTNANTTIRVDNGSSGTGDTYLFGATSSNERALGAYASGSLTSIFGAAFVNTSGTTLTSFTLSCTSEQWKDGGSTAAVLNISPFSYGIGNAGVLTLNSATGFTNVTGLDLKAKVNNTSADVTLDGNLAANRTVIAPVTVSGISWAPNQVLFIRWSDPNDPGNDDGLGVDDISFSASPPSDTTPPTVTSITRAAGSTNPSSATSVDYTVTFSEAVTGVDTTDFTVTTTTGSITGATVSAVTGSGTSYNVIVNGYTGTGTIRLDLIDDDSIKDVATPPNPLGGTGAGNGTFTGGETFTIASASPITGALLSEFRLSGPGSAGTGDSTDEFIELANTINASLNVTGWTITADVTTVTLSGNIPAYGHYLIAGTGYSLGTYAGANLTLSAGTDIPLNATLVLKNADGVMVDKVNGNGALVPTSSTTQYSYVRRLESGLPADTDTDSSDFNLVDISSTSSTVDVSGVGLLTGARLGAPGPQNLASPIQRNTSIAITPISIPGNGLAGTAVTPEARYVSKNSTIDPKGRLSLRYNIKNKSTTTTVTSMRFRIVAITAGTSSTAGVADIRAISSGEFATMPAMAPPFCKRRSLWCWRSPRYPPKRL
ncbi:hypothetical protein IAD21_04427 [Abditibacteriota bacterium]|nr:hypothetical protein IAD21_04427 [Abditibacteriota bacterium]